MQQKLKLATLVSPLETEALHTVHITVLLLAFSGVKFYQFVDVLLTLALTNVTLSASRKHWKAILLSRLRHSSRQWRGRVKTEEVNL